MTYEEAKTIINKMDWSKLTNDELSAIETMVKLAEPAADLPTEDEYYDRLAEEAAIMQQEISAYEDAIEKGLEEMGCFAVV